MDQQNNSNHQLIKEIRALYSVEYKLGKMLPRIIGKVNSTPLKKLLNRKSEESQKQIQRLERVFWLLGIPPFQKAGDQTLEILERHIENDHYTSRELLDAAIVISMQQIQHHQKVAYMTASVQAYELDYGLITSLLYTSLEEENALGRHLSNLARESFNHSTWKSLFLPTDRRYFRLRKPQYRKLKGS